MSHFRSADQSYTLSYKVRNHFLNKSIMLKNRFGMNTEIQGIKPFAPKDRNMVFIDVQMTVFNIHELKINPELVTNSLDRKILLTLQEELETIKKFKSIDMYNNHVGQVIGITVPLSMTCNYRNNGYQSDALGITLEWMEEATGGFYKEEEYESELDVLINENGIGEERGSGYKDFSYKLFRIVDNQRKIGPLWCNVGGSPLLVSPVYDKNKTDGIYIYTSGESKKLKIINIDEITKDVLAANGLSKNKIDMENTPHTKLYIEQNKTIEFFKKRTRELEDKITSLEGTIVETENKFDKVIDKLTVQLANSISDGKYKDQIINKLKENSKEYKEREAFLTKQQLAAHKQEIEKIKSNQDPNNLLQWVKVFKELIGFASLSIKF